MEMLRLRNLSRVGPGVAARFFHREVELCSLRMRDCARLHAGNQRSMQGIEQFVCADCSFKGALTIHGACARCGSQSVASDELLSLLADLPVGSRISSDRTPLTYLSRGGAVVA